MRYFYGLLAATALMSAQAIADGHDTTPAWLERTTLSVTESEDADVNFEFETIQPLMQTPETLRHTVFFQGRLASQDGDETVNVGLGYRNLSEDEDVLYGVNAFYDATTEYKHRRGSIGFEALGKSYTFRGNVYSAFSKEKSKIKGAVTTYQSALDGYDYSLEMPVPYTPWARLNATGYKWTAKKGFDDISGARVTLLGNLNNQVSFELGADDNNYQGTDAFVKLMWNIDGNPSNGVKATLADGATDGEVFATRNLRDHTLDKVVRNNTIIVQTRGGVVIGRSD